MTLLSWESKVEAMLRRVILASLISASVSATALADSDDARAIPLQPSYALVLGRRKIDGRFVIKAVDTGKSFTNELECMQYLSGDGAAWRNGTWAEARSRETPGLVLGTVSMPEWLVDRLDDPTDVFFHANKTSARQSFVAPDLSSVANEPWRLALYVTAKSPTGSEIRAVTGSVASNAPPGREFETENDCEGNLLLRREVVWEAFHMLSILASTDPHLLTEKAVIGMMCTPRSMSDFVTKLVPAYVQGAGLN
jgi:hypothetical protein